MCGISQDEEKIILKSLSPFFKEYDFYYYGSRARGDFRPLSDLDILIKGQKAFDTLDLENLKNVFDNSNLPFIVNLVDFQNITEKFYASIKDDLIKLN